MKTEIKGIIVVILLLCATTLCAQTPLHFGVKAGINLSDYTNDIENNDIKVGYNAGLTATYRLSRSFYLMSGLEVASKGTRVKDINPLDEVIPTEYARDKVTYNPVYLQIPIHAGYRLRAATDMVVLFHTGPFVSYGVGGKITEEITRGDNYTKNRYDAFGKHGLLKRWDIGIGLGTGFAFREMSLNFGYDLGFLNAYKGDASIKNNTAHISVAYRFL